MGEARKRREQQAQNEPLIAAAQQACHALKRLATAASEWVGSDCYLHAALGQVLMRDLGFDLKLVAGYAAWRVGKGGGDVISHLPHTKSYVPEGLDSSKSLAYHAWLESQTLIVDLTLYQVARKAKALDAADGGSTNIEWNPEFLILPRSQVKTLEEVGQSYRAGEVYYQVEPALTDRLSDGFTLDEEDVANARLIMRNPDATVFGPNHFKV